MDKEKGKVLYYIVREKQGCCSWSRGYLGEAPLGGKGTYFYWDEYEKGKAREKATHYRSKEEARAGAKAWEGGPDKAVSIITVRAKIKRAYVIKWYKYDGKWDGTYILRFNHDNQDADWTHSLKAAQRFTWTEATHIAASWDCLEGPRVEPAPVPYYVVRKTDVQRFPTREAAEKAAQGWGLTSTIVTGPHMGNDAFTVVAEES